MLHKFPKKAIAAFCVHPQPYFPSFPFFFSVVPPPHAQGACSFLLLLGIVLDPSMAAISFQKDTKHVVPALVNKKDSLSSAGALSLSPIKTLPIMKRLSSINLFRISFRPFLFSCSLFFACAHTHAAPFSPSKILAMGMLFVVSKTQGNTPPEVSLGLTDSNNSLGIQSYDNEVMNHSNLTNSYTVLTGCNNETFSPSTLRLIDAEGNSVECSWKSSYSKYDYIYKTGISCTHDNLKNQRLSLAMCDNNECVMLPMLAPADVTIHETFCMVGIGVFLCGKTVLLCMKCGVFDWLCIRDDNNINKKKKHEVVEGSRP